MCSTIYCLVGTSLKVDSFGMVIQFNVTTNLKDHVHQTKKMFFWGGLVTPTKPDKQSLISPLLSFLLQIVTTVDRSLVSTFFFCVPKVTESVAP